MVLEDCTSPVPRALIAGLQGATCSQVMPTLEPMYEALMARPEEVRVLLFLHDGLAHDPEGLARGLRKRGAFLAFSSGASTWETTPRKRQP